mgnify:CR=1 FL=1
MLYDFHKGQLSKSLNELGLIEIKKNSNYLFEPIENISYKEVEKIGERFFYKKGADYYMMFSYKYSTFILNNDKLPSFHVCDCRTIKEYSGFVFATKMPVKVYCRNRKKELVESQNLSLCGNCIKESQRSLFKFLAKDKPWFDYVLEYAVSNNKLAKKTKTDGYVIMWKQISEAVREKNYYCCTNCKINLEQKKFYLEVHHMDYNKKNNHINNLKPLCVLCHATVDKRHLSIFKSKPFKVQHFIDDNKNYIIENNLSELNLWNKS